VNTNFWQGKKVLVTGASGFLGSWLSKELIEIGAHVWGTTTQDSPLTWKFHGISKKIERVSLDITSSRDVEAFFQKKQFDFCFHLAGKANPSICETNPVEAVKVNIGGAVTIGSACARFGVPLLFSSTVAVFGQRDRINDDTPVSPAGLYGMTKVVSENILRALSEKKLLDVIIVRITNLYGPINPNEKGHYINNNAKNLLQNRPLEKKHRYFRDFVFIQDAVEALLLLGPHVSSHSGESFILSQGKTYSGEEIVDNMQAKMQGKKISFTPLPEPIVESVKLRSLTHWEPRHSLEQGIDQTIQWYRENNSFN
jgi:CDP-glucose 4,6-dehydratase